MAGVGRTTHGWPERSPAASEQCMMVRRAAAGERCAGTRAGRTTLCWQGAGGRQQPLVEQRPAGRACRLEARLHRGSCTAGGSAVKFAVRPPTCHVFDGHAHMVGQPVKLELPLADGGAKSNLHRRSKALKVINAKPFAPPAGDPPDVSRAVQLNRPLSCPLQGSSGGPVCALPPARTVARRPPWAMWQSFG